ncbi:hypothetical protein BX600DRAFT_450541 [Xylariales sp. PMI_506]|nr:hypothetical protein BX600DRAFT_450541 [Xylariales sp. PMI_506]
MHFFFFLFFPPLTQSPVAPHVPSLSQVGHCMRGRQTESARELLHPDLIPTGLLPTWRQLLPTKSLVFSWPSGLFSALQEVYSGPGRNSPLVT